MSVINSPGLVTNGLGLFYDFQNRNKSYISQTTTNQFAIPTPDSSGNVGFAVNGTGTFKRVYSGTYGGYDIQPNDIVYRYDLGSNGCHYHGNDVTITSGLYPTFTFDYYLSPDVTSFNDTYMANFESLGSGVSGSISLPNYNLGVWQTLTINGTVATATSGLRMLLYPGGCSGGRLAATGYLLMKNPQVTFNSSHYQLPFVQGSRTAATGLLDLTTNRSTSSLNITYPSGVTPLTYNILNSYNGAVTTDSTSLLNTDTHSIFFMIRFNTTSSYGSNGYSGSWDKIFSFNAGGSDRSPGIWRYPSERKIHWRYDPGNSDSDFSSDIAGTYPAGGTPFTIDTWYYVGVTKNGATTTIYVNGKSLGTGSVSNPKTAGNASIVLFEYYPTDLASMGLLQVYNRVLSGDEVFQNYSAIRGRYNI